MSYTDYRELADFFPNEVITHSHLREIPLPGAGTFALITLDNGIDCKPTTSDPNSLIELATGLGMLTERAAAGISLRSALPANPDT